MLITRIRETLERCRTAKTDHERMNALSDHQHSLEVDPPLKDEVLSLMQQMLVTPEMPEAYLVPGAAWSSLDGQYAPVLSKIVMSKDCAPFHEQAIELLGAIRDPASIPCLICSIEYRWDYDVWRSVPRKALQALAEFDTEEAVSAIRQAAKSDDMLISEEALMLLQDEG